jgi:hypothetical protein
MVVAVVPSPPAPARSSVQVSISWAGSPPPTPVGTIGNGTCGATNYGGDCNSDPKGAWDAKKEGILNLTACVARAKSCKMANYVSFSLKDWNSDCSWYSSCDMSHLCEDCSKCGIGCPSYVPYSSEVVKVAPPAPPAADTDLFVMPLLVHDDNASGKRSGRKDADPRKGLRGAARDGSGSRSVLLVSKTEYPINVTLSGDGVTNTVATVLDGSVDGIAIDPEPGFVAPVERLIGKDGILSLGPYAVAVVDAGRG